MWFMILGRDGAEGLSRRPALRPAHLERAAALAAAGRLLLAGPLLDVPGDEGRPQGSLIVGDFADAAEAEAWVAADPYVTGGVFAEVEIRPFHQVLP
jgi:uncharacterized protein YciI